jgi:hypothetical protein
VGGAKASEGNGAGPRPPTGKSLVDERYQSSGERGTVVGLAAVIMGVDGDVALRAMDHVGPTPIPVPVKFRE